MWRGGMAPAAAIMQCHGVIRSAWAAAHYVMT